MSDERFLDRMSIVNLQIRSMMCVPLVVRAEVLGLIHIDTTSRSRSFVEEDLQLLAGVAAQAAVSIKNARLMDQVQREAATRGQLQRYLSPDLVDRIQRGEMKLDIGGTTAHGTVFFSDIIGFTAMSERMPPGEVVSLLNRYFHVMEEIIFRHGGTIDKFGGDSIMAFWGVLVQRERDALGAVSAAVEMQNALFAFNCELRAQGRQPVRMGIGLNTGDFVAGNIGSEQKIEFTVIGDAVNLAQRIESLAGRGQVLISPSTYEQVASETCVVAFEPVAVKGKSEPVRVYNVRSVRPAQPPGGRPGIILTVPVELTVKASGDTTQFSTAAQIVWGAPRPSAGSVVELEIVSERRLAAGASCTLKPLIRGASVPPFEARVLYASEAPAEEKGDCAAGGAMLVAENPPPQFAGLLAPGSRTTAEKTLEELGRD
jgi:class 3 adenylate cyclase